MMHQTSRGERASISGLAGDTSVRSGDASTPLPKIFDAQRVQAAIHADVQITQTFSMLAPRAVATYADGQIRVINEQLQHEADDGRRAALLADKERWGDKGAYRVALHAAVGGLAGGVQGAAGAGASAALVPQLAQALDQTDLPPSVKSAALATAGTLLGAAVGGNVGAATALGEAANNFLSHPEARQREAAHQRLLQCTDDSCRQRARQEIARLDALDQWRDRQLADACLKPSSALCQGWHAALAEAKQSYIGDVAHNDLTQSVSSERRQINEQEFLYRRRIADPFAYGVAKRLMKLTPPALALGVGLTSYELTKAIIDVGLAEASVAIGQGLLSLPADLKARLHSDDPAVRGEALVDTLAVTGASTVIVGKLQQTGNKALIRVFDEQAKVTGERAKSAKLQIELNNRRDDLDAYFEYKHLDGSWSWPKNDGALPGTVRNITLENGQSIDRYGSDLGHYAAPLGELVEGRSLAPGGPAEVYRRYEVIKPIPRVNTSITAPAFGNQGGGVQFRFEKPLRWYVENGYLKEVKR